MNLTYPEVMVAYTIAMLAGGCVITLAAQDFIGWVKKVRNKRRSKSVE